MTLDKDLEIIRLSSEESIGEIVKLHQEVFQNVLIGQLGNNFTFFLYRRLLSFQDNVILVAIVRKRIVGFVAGITREDRFYNFKFYLVALLFGIQRIVHQPKLFLDLLRYAKRRIVLSEKEKSAELFSIAVASDFQQKGIGKRLISSFDEFMRSYGIRQYKVVTDMPYSLGYKLYETLDFTLDAMVDLYGLTIRRYLRYL